MAFNIPKIQWNNVDLTGDLSSGSAVISNIADTSEVVVGMFINGLNIPDNTSVLSKTTNTVTMSAGKTATGNATGQAIYFGYEVQFDYPPIEKNGEILDSKSTVNVSLSGVRQVSTNYIEVNRKLVFSFLSPAIYALVETFAKNWGIYGKSFRYFENKTSLTGYVIYELDGLNFSPKKIAPRGEDQYVWEVPLDFIRVL